MEKLLIIADDLTGALDTSVQLSKEGAITQVSFDVVDALDNFTSFIDVMVIDTETRHSNPTEAYSIVYNIVKKAKEHNISLILKKTDSALRGNVGAELQAMLDASGEKRIHFIPSFPQMNRSTIKGIHYIDGVKVNESVFGSDPFDPVRHAKVSDILNDSYNAGCMHKMLGEVLNNTDEGIIIYDSQKAEDISNIVTELINKNEMRFIAGCSGLANILPSFIKFNHKNGKINKLTTKTLIVCGSINPISRSQCRYAVKQGVSEFVLKPSDKLEQNWIKSDEAKKIVMSIIEKSNKEDLVILNANGDDEPEATKVIASDKLMSVEQIRRQIAKTLGKLTRNIVDQGFDGNIFLMGGDVLFQFLMESSITTITPLEEIENGIVISDAHYMNRTLKIISKSGGFGSEDLFIRIANRLKLKD